MIYKYQHNAATLVQSTWMNARCETSHTLDYKEQICKHELVRGEKNARVFFTPPAETALVISSNTRFGRMRMENLHRKSIH